MRDSSSASTTYTALQAGRALAAGLVVLFHLGGTFAQDKYFGAKAFDLAFAWGDAGVDFFFVLSGFLITTLHFDDFGRPEALRAYAVKRALRIYPTYWLVCLLVYAAALAAPALRQALPTDPVTILKALALLPQDPARVGGTGSPILFVAWSLQYEMLFYVVIGLTIASRAVGVLAALALLALGLGCTLGSGCSFPQTFLGSNHVLLFAMGVVSAAMVRRPLHLAKPLWWAALGTAAFVAFGLFEVIFGRQALAVDRSLVFGALSALVITSLAIAEKRGELTLKQRWVALQGDASYALYLLHIPVISVMCKLFLRIGVSSPAALVAAYLLTFLVCVGCATVFHLGVERPLLAWLRSTFGRSTAPARKSDERPRRVELR